MNKEKFNSLPEKERLGSVLEGVAFYSSVHTPNMSAVKKFNGDPYFIVNLGLEGAELDKAKDMGLKVKDPQGQITLPFVELKRAVRDGKDPEEFKPEIVDSQQKPVPSTVLIGNGSRVRCKFARRWSDMQGGGVKTSLYKVQVRDLIEFKPTDRDFVMDDNGYKAPEMEDKSDIGDELPF